SDGYYPWSLTGRRVRRLIGRPPDQSASASMRAPSRANGDSSWRISDAIAHPRALPDSRGGCRRALVRFEELVKKYYGKPINFVLHKNSELGLEKDYFAFMNQGITVDYGIVSPAHMSTFSKAAPFIDAPFLFR